MPAEQYHDFPLAPRDRAWDKNEAIPRLRRWASKDGSGDKEQMDWGKYRKVFFWHEAGELSDFGQFKFPYCDIIDGEPHVVHNAVQNALARIDGSNIPEEDKPAVRRVAERQMARFEDGENTNARSGTAYSRRKFGEPTDAQLEKINQLAKRPLDKSEVFVFTAKLAGDMVIPERHIQLSKPLLEVFKQDAINGVSLLLDHSWAGFFGRPKPAIAYGRTFDAYMKKSNVEGEKWELYADHYIPRGIEIDGISTDSLIYSIETGTMFDTSIGWGASNYECSICHNDIRDYSKCSHWPGQMYKNEETGEEELCYAIAKVPGGLYENSIVFDGAYPTAGVLSQVGGEEAKGDWVVVDNLKNTPPDTQLLHIFSATKGKLYTFAKRESLEKRVYLSVPDLNSTKGGVYAMDNERKYSQEEVDALVKAEVEKAVAEALANVPPAESYMTKEQATEALGQEYTAEEVLRFAKEGIACHNEAIEEAIKEGVRAMGNDFPAETWKRMLSSMNIQDIHEVAKTWHKQAEDTIPAGRTTIPTMKKGAGATEEIPPEAYKA